MDRLEAMTIVLTVAEAGSLAAAARRLNLPAATASRKISDLEAHLRARLFDRSTRKLALTDAGRTYVAAAKRILADLDEAERCASGEYTAPTGDLVVTAPVGLGRAHLVPILAEFLRAYPDIDIRLLLDDRILNLSESHFDVALRIAMLPDSRLIALRLGTVRRLVCASPDYLASRGTPRTPEDLSHHDCVSYPELMAPAAWTFQREGMEFAVPVRSRLSVTNIEATCEAARAGVGIAAAFCYNVRPWLDDGSLRTVLEEFQPAPVPVNLVYAAGRFLPIKLRAFLDFASVRLKARLAR